GFFVFDFSPWTKVPLGIEEFDKRVETRMKCLRVLNAHLVCLYSAVARGRDLGLSKWIVEEGSVFVMRDFDKPFDGVSGGLDTGRLTEVAMTFSTDSLARLPAPYLYGHQWTWMLSSQPRIPVSTEELQASFDQLGELLVHSSDNTLLLTELLARSCKAFEENN